MSNRVTVSIMAGVASNGINGRDRFTSHVVKDLARDTVRSKVRELKQWASGIYDTVSDTTDVDGIRIVTARHYVTGVENVRRIVIKPTSTSK